jgi:hypothetical protein
MLRVWAACCLLYAVLPFQLVDRQFTLGGLGVLLLFLTSFCLGTLAIRPVQPAQGAAWLHDIDFSRTERVLAAVSSITVLVMLLDMRDKNVFDLGESYATRSDQAAALMEGAASSSSLAFQIGFLTYPASFVYLVRAIVFDRKLRFGRLAVFAFLPILMTTLVMGGRAPLLYAILISGFAYGTRKLYLRRSGQGRSHAGRGLGGLARIGITLFVAVSLYYFIAVFFTRAEVVGGVSGMFEVAETIWGISFRGAGSQWMFDLLGNEVTYLIFIFTWYVVQGLLMGNFLFSGYDGPMQLGVYGVDLVSALMRRLDGEQVARNFDALDRLGIYGFLPAAWGSLFVDFRFWGLAVAALWGALVAVVYQHIRRGRDARWLLMAPFITMGILFSFINTPIGFSNGLVTHFWMVVAFVMARPLPRLRSAPVQALLHH